MLAATPQGPGRISQLLPSVKCSNCNLPVPLSELGEHICAPAPPVPSLPRPSFSPQSASVLLPNRFLGRVASPGVPPPPDPRSFQGQPQQQQQQQRTVADRLRINPVVNGSNGPRSSPLFRPEPQDGDPNPNMRMPPPASADFRMRSNGPNPNDFAPPMALGRERSSSHNGPPPNLGPRYPPNRTGTPNSATYGNPPNRIRSPATSPNLPFNPPPPILRNGASPAPSFQGSITRNVPSPGPMGRGGPPGSMPMRGPPPPGGPPFANPPRSYTPGGPPSQGPPTPISERDIDTKIGGEAGMAGVGRRGFAAAARAAMFAVAPKPPGPQQNSPNLYPQTPRFLDTSDTASNDASTPRSPIPSSPFAGSYFPGQSDEMARALPNPPTKIDTSITNSSNDRTPIDYNKTPMAAAPGGPTSPYGVRMPFYDKLKNMIPGDTTPTTAQPTNKDGYYDDADFRSRSASVSTKGSQRSNPRQPTSPTSGSEFGGLAYDNDDESSRGGGSQSSRSRKRSLPAPPPPLPTNAASIGRAGAPYGQLTSSPDALDERQGVPIRKPNGAKHSRNNSASSSYSSTSSVDGLGRQRTSSALIASALGLSQTPPSAYAKMGGPGLHNRDARPLGRSTSNSSLGSKSAYSRGTSMAPGNGPNGLDVLERSLLKNNDQRAGDLVKSKSTTALGKQRGSGSVRGTEYTASEADPAFLGYYAKPTQRSKTVQGVSSPDNKPIKLPARARTTTATDIVGADVSRPKKRKEKVCVKCSKHIDDGRWIQVDTGSILCERCWKNMYLPKCRRCSLPIERQAVSSSDGQLKGKYHKECFNCNTCKKPFPDKTFYVFDGKPFCAYHYHESNDSLCAAAICGQPIEGPCAVSHAGDRYHPHCMTCEYPGYPECRERLKEYWEVDGSMLCEHHATSVGDDDYGSRWGPNSKAMKRVTRFIDLAGLSGNNNDNASPRDDDSGLR
ncbi:hypothetical protein FA15DRAFT_699705 [Coprinopsis marcescibilis]|uniref:LIM zinc-binding domain-containing protein n=1 Tax=Coprinopsis marcescibilis TaxID=230819 RepID=A0A5C3LAS7_COPMA|nr:hypothetical protein FA15DRAFT_699705 [Coprinopsis marcescibilis]